jgi:ribonuclease HI
VLLRSFCGKQASGGRVGRESKSARIEYPFGLDLPDELIEYTGYFETNNNRMELRACVFAHEWICEQGENLSGLSDYRASTWPRNLT